MRRAAVYVLCFCSGLAGLTYEVVWLRLLAVVVGGTHAATAAVLAAVMIGMGLGAAWIGRRADRMEPLRLYGALEIGLGVFALLVPALAGFAASATPGLLGWVGPGMAGTIVRFAIAALIVLAPAMAMGATVPVLARVVERTHRGPADVVGPSAGAVYSLNAAGAALGAVLTGYVLLGAWGVRATNAAAAGLDVAVGVVAIALAFVLGRHGSAAESRADHTGAADPGGPTEHAAPALPPRIALALAFASGACVLGLETLWTRALLIVFGHDVHAFASMLASVLVGLALGAGLYRAVPERARAHRMLIPLLFCGLAVTALLSFAGAGALYLARGEDLFGLAPSLAITRSEDLGLALQPAFALACILVPTVASGALLPALCASHRRRQGAGRRVGEVLAANTIGSVVGALAVPLALVPTLGIARSAWVLAGVAALAGTTALFVLVNERSRRWRGAAVVVAATVLAAAALPGDLPQRMLARKIGPAHLDFLHYEEGRSATVAVVRSQIDGDRQLFVNGINEVTTRLVHDQSFALLGHLGPLLHPAPRDVAVICLGAGLSAGAVATHEPRRLDIVDLEPAVVPAVEHFSDLNGDLATRSDARYVFDDGRSHLATSGRRYDVIVVDSTHPRAIDSWMLYTRELYVTAHAALDEDGWLVQWVPLHGLSVDEMRIIAGTFADAFPNGSLWVNAGVEAWGPSAYVLLVGPRGDAPIDVATLSRSLERPGVRESLARWGLGSVEEILECFVAGPDTLRTWTDDVPRNTDDLPYTQALTRFSRSAPMTMARLLEIHEPVTPHLAEPPDQRLADALERRREAQGLLLAGRTARAAVVCGDDCAKHALFAADAARGLPHYRALAERYAEDPDRLVEAAAGLIRLGMNGEAVDVLDRAARQRPDDPRLQVHLGLAQAARGDDEAAIAAYRRAIELSPDLALAHLDLGLTLMRAGRDSEGVHALGRAVELEPELAETHAALGWALASTRGGGARARSELERALEIDPRNTSASVSLGRLHLRSGDDATALRVLERGRSHAPFDTDVLYTMAIANVHAERDREARRLLERVLWIDPDDGDAEAALSDLSARVARRVPIDTSAPSSSE